MRSHLIALVTVAAIVLAACGSDSNDQTATTAAPTTAATETTATTSTAPTTTAPTTSATSAPEAADEQPAFDDLEEVDDTPLAAGVFTETELLEALPGGEWEITSRLEAAETPGDTQLLCGEPVPGIPDSIGVTGSQAGADLTFSQQILLEPDPAWVELFRQLVTCEDAPDITGPIELEIVPIPVNGTIDAVVIQAIDSAVDRPYSVVVSLESATYSMLVSFEASEPNLIDATTIVALVEQAVARLNE